MFITTTRSLLSAHAARHVHPTILSHTGLEVTIQPLRATRFFSSSSNNNNRPRPDPFARRPNKVCDPYGQEGKPLEGPSAENLLTTVHPEWTLEGDEYGNGGIPTRLTRRFLHPDFIAGASFLTHVAAVGQMNDHYPSIQLHRRLDSKRKQWLVESTITCHTFVLQGLSHHDFFVATVS